MNESLQELTLLALAGAPGSGKSRLGFELEKKMNAGRVVAGDALRAIAAEDTELGRFVYSYTSTRSLVPGELVGKVMKNKLLEYVGRKEVVIVDGYPRNLDQLKVMDRITTELNWVVISVPIEECRRRIAAASDRGQRLDDRHEATKEKGFEVFQTETLPMIEFLKGRNPQKVLDVDGLKTPEQIAEDVRKYFAK